MMILLYFIRIANVFYAKTFSIGFMRQASTFALNCLLLFSSSYAHNIWFDHCIRQRMAHRHIHDMIFIYNGYILYGSSIHLCSFCDGLCFFSFPSSRRFKRSLCQTIISSPTTVYRNKLKPFYIFISIRISNSDKTTISSIFVSLFSIK